MVEFAKRPEVTVSTMGKVHNPSGEGVRAVSSQVQAKMIKQHKNGTSSNGSAEAAPSATDMHLATHHHGPKDSHETKTKEGTAKRNIARKKTADKDSGNYDSTKKKQGGHGKGQWKEELLDSTLYEETDATIDEKDPIFDNAEDTTKYVLTSSGVAPPAAGSNGEAVGLTDALQRGYDPETAKPVYGPLLTQPEFKAQLSDILREYFDSCDTTEVITSLLELGCCEYHDQVVKKAVSMALDQGPRERELVSRLLTALHPTPLSMADLETGFVTLLDAVDDLSKDVPEAKTIVASFVARAVVDEVVSPAFLSEQNNQRVGDVVIEKAVSLLSREHCTARLERVWGPGDGRPVRELKIDMDQLLHEYLLSRELDEAARCVKELAAPHFHHELVKRGVTIAMESASKDENNMDAMAALFGFLVRNAIVSEYQVKKGLLRVRNRLDDVTLDVPNAPQLLALFEKLAAEQGCLPPSTAEPV